MIGRIGYVAANAASAPVGSPRSSDMVAGTTGAAASRLVGVSFESNTGAPNAWQSVHPRAPSDCCAPRTSWARAHAYGLAASWSNVVSLPLPSRLNALPPVTKTGSPVYHGGVLGAAAA